MGGALTARRARLQARRARRPGHELLDAAPAQRRLRHLRGDPLPGLPEGARAPALARADPAALGPRRGERLRAAHDDRPAAEHAARTRSCCTWRSATTRSPTRPPRSRRARSARAAYRPVLDPGRSPWPRFQLIPPIAKLPVRRLRRRLVGHRPAPDVARRWWARPRRRRPTRPTARGDDPHDTPRATPSARVQKSEFLKIDGRVVDVCGGGPCYAALDRPVAPGRSSYAAAHAATAPARLRGRNGLARRGDRGRAAARSLLRRLHDRLGEHDRHRARRALGRLLAGRAAGRPPPEHARRSACWR